MFIRSKGQLTIAHIHPNPKPGVEMQSLNGQLLMSDFLLPLPVVLKWPRLLHCT